MKKTVEDPQFQIDEKTAEAPQTQKIQVTQTSESLGIECDEGHEPMLQGNDSVSVAKDVEDEANEVSEKSPDCMVRSSASGSTRQQHKQRATTHTAQEKGQGREEREKGRKGQRGRGQEGRKKEEREAEEGGGELVEKDVMGWTEVTRNKRKKMVQIFVKMDGMKTVTMEVSPEDKVQKILNTANKSDRDVYGTSGGRILKGSDKLKSCEVRDGSTVEVTSRMRGGGRHKDKKSKFEKKQTTNPERPEQKRDGEARSGEGPESIPMDEVLRQLEESEEYQKKIEHVSEGSEGEVQQKVQDFLACMQVSWMIKEQYEPLESGVWRAVEARRKRWGEEQEERRQAQQGQEQSKQGKQVRFREEQQLGRRKRKTQANLR